MSTTSAAPKICCSCGVNVSREKRMKDSQGRYWCLNCGDADRKKKTAEQRLACAGCRELFMGADMKYFGELQYCKKCFKKVQRRQKGSFVERLMETVAGGGGGGKGSKGEGRSKNKILVIALLVLGLVSVIFNFVLE